MIPGERFHSCASEILPIKRRQHLLVPRACILTHVLVEHRQHNKGEQCQSGQKDHERLQIPAEDFERTVIHGSGLSDASKFVGHSCDSQLF
jgi:hypothetical protein